MGLVLLIPGLIFLLNGVTWFPGEEGVGKVLVILGVALLVLQVVLTLVGLMGFKRMANRMDRNRW